MSDIDINFSLPSAISAISAQSANNRYQPSISATSTNIGFNPSLSDHLLESNNDDLWDNFDTIQQPADYSDLFSDTSLVPSASISQQSGTLKKIPSKHCLLNNISISFLQYFPRLYMLILVMFSHFIETLQKYFKSDRVKEQDGSYQHKFICKICNKALSPNNASHTLNYHVKMHRAQDKGKGVDREVDCGGTLVQSTLTGTSTTLQKKEAIIKAALTWIVIDYISFSIFDPDSFRALTCLINPIINISCAAMVRDRLHDYRLGLQEWIELLLSETFKVGSMTIDGWTSDSNRPFMGIILHWLGSDFRRYECTLNLVPHPYPYNGESIAKLISM
jgi:hypothetical protein